MDEIKQKFLLYFAKIHSKRTILFAILIIIFAIIVGFSINSLGKRAEEKRISVNLQYIQCTEYPDGSHFEATGYRGAYNCFGFAKKIQYLLFDNVVSWNYDGTVNSGLEVVTYTKKPYTSNKIKAIMSQARPGDIIQMDSGKTTYQHSMIFCGATDNGFTVYDANWEPWNEVDIRTEAYNAYNDLDCNKITILRNERYYE